MSSPEAIEADMSSEQSEIDENYHVRPKIAVVKTIIPGCFELRPTVARDSRGFFAKVFHRPLWKDLGLQTTFAEEYATYSLPWTMRFALPASSPWYTIRSSSVFEGMHSMSPSICVEAHQRMASISR